MAQITMHASLVRFTNQHIHFNMTIGTVVEILPSLCQRYPLLKSCMLNASGELTPYINIYINGKNLNQCLPQMPLEQDDKVDVLTALVGG